MVDYENPPPPGGVPPNSGKWDKSGVAPKWLPHRWYEHHPWWQWIVGLFTIIGAIVGLIQLF